MDRSSRSHSVDVFAFGIMIVEVLLNLPAFNNFVLEERYNRGPSPLYETLCKLVEEQFQVKFQDFCRDPFRTFISISIFLLFPTFKFPFSILFSELRQLISPLDFYGEAETFMDAFQTRLCDFIRNTLATSSIDDKEVLLQVDLWVKLVEKMVCRASQRLDGPALLQLFDKLFPNVSQSKPNDIQGALKEEGQIDPKAETHNDADEFVTLNASNLQDWKL